MEFRTSIEYEIGSKRKRIPHQLPGEEFFGNISLHIRHLCHYHPHPHNHHQRDHLFPVHRPSVERITEQISWEVWKEKALKTEKELISLEQVNEPVSRDKFTSSYFRRSKLPQIIRIFFFNFKFWKYGTVKYI